MGTITIAFQTNKPINAYAALAAQVEAYRFDGITVYNDMLYQPAWLPLFEIARATQQIRIGVAAVNPFTCHPINIAGQIALIDELAPGRVYLGLARGAWLDYVGVRPKTPIRALREAFAAVQHLLSGSTEALIGDIFPISGGDRLRWSASVRPKIPFLLGTWGVKTMQACLPYADEIKLGGTANPDVVGWMRDQMGIQASKGIVIGAVTVVDEDGEAARALARREVALYLPVVAELDPTVVIDPERLQRLKAAAAAYEFKQAAALVSDELLDRFAFAGTPAQVAEQTINLFEAGADRVEFGTPHGISAEKGLHLLGTQTLPLVRKILNG
ncbi:MAG: LLM class flavin-dependent oxidoreductase [Candidatus Promineifilaceae bacterium]